MHRDVFRIVLRLTFAALAIGVGGCGPKQVDVTGKVSYNGSPLGKAGGQIVFVGSNGIQVAASINPDGAYRATKVPIGPYRVAVYYLNPEAQRPKGPGLPRKGGPPSSAPVFLTPYKYASVDTSALSIEVKEGGTVFDADLTGPTIP